ncbi:uncharacterized [Tachysurus ichikawai]
MKTGASVMMIPAAHIIVLLSALTGHTIRSSRVSSRHVKLSYVLNSQRRLKSSSGTLTANKKAAELRQPIRERSASRSRSRRVSAHVELSAPSVCSARAYSLLLIR